MTGLPTTFATTCAIGDCDWKTVGVAEFLDFEEEAHRLDEHPWVGKGKLCVREAIPEGEPTTLEEVRAADVAAGGAACRVCGCTDNAACEEGCYWVAPDLCSVCADKASSSEGDGNQDAAPLPQAAAVADPEDRADARSQGGAPAGDDGATAVSPANPCAVCGNTADFGIAGRRYCEPHAYDAQAALAAGKPLPGAEA